MKQSELIRKLAQATGQSRAAAADQLDQLVTRILTTIRRGKPAEIPGLGQLVPGPGQPLRLVKKAGKGPA